MRLYEYLKSNEYPGRGIIIGQAFKKDYAFMAYFIMGRSVNSQNRIFNTYDTTFEIMPYKQIKSHDTSLTLYTPMYISGGNLIIANGSHSHDVYSAVSEGRPSYEALSGFLYEPDEPHYTPRIFGVLNTSGAPKYELGIAKKSPGSHSCIRSHFSYSSLEYGKCHIIHTYDCEQNGVLMPFCGEPFELIPPRLADIEEFADDIWLSLNNANRVALYVRFVKLNGSAFADTVRNRHKE